MDHHSKRKSIFRSLFLQVTITVLLLNIILASIIIYDTISIQKESAKALSQKIGEEIIGLSEFQRSALVTFEKSFYDLQKNILKKLIDMSKVKDLQVINLFEQLRNFGLDSVYHDLYIIEDNVVVNTTYMPDYGLDFSLFGEDHVKKLDKIKASKEYYAERFQFESSTKRLKSYSYQATPNGKYIIEIGSYSEIADKIMEMFRNRMKKIAEQNEKIVSVNYWFGTKDYQFPLIDEALNRYIPDSLLQTSFVDKRNVKDDFKIRDQKLNAELLYIQQDPSTRLPDFAISIVRDHTDKNKSVYKIIKRHISFTIINLVLVIGLIFIALRSLKNIYKPQEQE